MNDFQKLPKSVRHAAIYGLRDPENPDPTAEEIVETYCSGVATRKLLGVGKRGKVTTQG